jgi:hypothetical protein
MVEVYYNFPRSLHAAMFKQRGMFAFSNRIDYHRTPSVVSWSEFPAAGTEVPGSIPSASRFSENQWVWNGIHSAS